jgi:deoxycytidylate deaminase
MRPIDYFNLCRKIAINKDGRNFLIGAVGIRNDGVMVCARNLPVFFSNRTEFCKIPGSHAEQRVMAKMDYSGVLYVVRISKVDNIFLNSRPCKLCQPSIIQHKIKKVYYTAGGDMYGVWNLQKDTEILYKL